MNKLVAAILLAYPIIAESSEYRDFVKGWEGFSERVYPDSLGNKTIGWGLNITDPSSEVKLEGHGVSRSLLLVGQPISREVADRVLEQEVAAALVLAKETFPSFSSHKKEVRQILVDLAYNLRPQGLREFVKFRAAIEVKDYKKAAAELVDSKWYGQVKRRSKHHVEVLKGVK